jgi:hypothetical protein
LSARKDSTRALPRPQFSAPTRHRSELRVLIVDVVVKPAATDLPDGVIPHIALASTDRALSQRLHRPPGLALDLAIDQFVAQVIMLLSELCDRALNSVVPRPHLVRITELTCQAFACGRQFRERRFIELDCRPEEGALLTVRISRQGPPRAGSPSFARSAACTARRCAASRILASSSSSRRSGRVGSALSRRRSS